MLQVYLCRLRQFVGVCCTVDFVQGCLLYWIPLTASHQWLRLQWAHEHTDWHQVVFSDESRFSSWDHDGRIRVRRYAGERCLPGCVIERHIGLTLEVMVWGAISYHGRSNLLRIEGNINSRRYVREGLQPEVVPSFKASLEISFSRIMHAHMLQRLFETSVQPCTCNFFLGLLNHRICRPLSKCRIWLISVSLVV
ncbi:transposable element Tcb1 transposase [Trichonephila clavipes]|nr:transposable element Tcb1 transposase [Trichonephila clavipes]